jgi:transcription elongation factor GreA
MKIMAQEILLTAEAYKKKVDELESLKTTGRDEIAERIKEARSFGDLSENSEYDEALNDQAKMEARINQLENELKKARILDESTISTESIHVGSKVKIRDIDYDEIEEYQILGESQANPDEGIISDQSAVGKALLEKKVGETVKVTLPNGNVISYEVLEISK